MSATFVPPTTAGVPPAAPHAATPSAPAHAERPASARVALFGASGYAGQEFARLAASHPGIEVVAMVSREHAGRPVASVLAGWDPGAQATTFVAPSAVEDLLAAGGCDTIVACLPHGAWRTLLANAPAVAACVQAAEKGAAPVRVVDLSSDHRDGSDGYVYGLPEAFRDQILGARLIANPGCYPTAAALALMPALEAGCLAGPVTVTALSGVSGAGRAASLRTSFVELDGGASIYRAGEEHPHVAEMEIHLGRIAARGPVGAASPAGSAIDVAFVPNLVPMPRGILLTAIAPLTRALAPGEAQDAYRARYAREPFVRVLADGVWPETRAVRSSNRCDVAVTTVHGGHTLLATAAIDNLVKGAAGQAIQNLNLVLGWPEPWGLPVNGTPW